MYICMYVKSTSVVEDMDTRPLLKAEERTWGRRVGGKRRAYAPFKDGNLSRVYEI